MELFEVVAFIYSFSPNMDSSVPSTGKKPQHRWILCAVLKVPVKKRWRVAKLCFHSTFLNAFLNKLIGFMQIGRVEQVIYLMGSYFWSVVIFHTYSEGALVLNSPISLEVPEYLTSTRCFL